MHEKKSFRFVWCVAIVVASFSVVLTGMHFIIIHTWGIPWQSSLALLIPTFLIMAPLSVTALLQYYKYKDAGLVSPAQRRAATQARHGKREVLVTALAAPIGVAAYVYAAGLFINLHNVPLGLCFSAVGLLCSYLLVWVHWTARDKRQAVEKSRNDVPGDSV